MPKAFSIKIWLTEGSQYSLYSLLLLIPSATAATKSWTWRRLSYHLDDVISLTGAKDLQHSHKQRTEEVTNQDLVESITQMNFEPHRYDN